MFHLNDVLQPQTGEQVEAVIRHKAVTLLPWLAVSGILIAWPFFVLFPVVRYGWASWIGLSVSLIAGIMIAVRSIWLWDSDVLVVTNRRLVSVSQLGLWIRHVSEAPLMSVREVRLERPSRWLGGTLHILTNAAAGEIVFTRVPRAEKIKARLVELSRLETPPPAVVQALQEKDSLRHQVGDLLENAGESTLKAVEKLLKEPPTA